MNLQILSQKTQRRVIASIVGASVITGGIVYYGLSPFGQVSQPTKTAQPQATWQIVALGRLEPQTEVIKLSVPAALNSDRIGQLLVKRGDRVNQGQIVAILASKERLEAILSETKTQVSVAQSELAQVKAGAKAGEVNAQQAEIVKLQAELAGEMKRQQASLTGLTAEVETFRNEYERHQFLYQQGAISASQFEQKRLTLQNAQARLQEAKANRNQTGETIQAQIQIAQANLARISEVRPVDIQTAKAKVEQALANVKRAEAELNQAYIRAPVTGQVLEIFAKPGEVVRENGIVSLGQTSQMQVVAEVYQSDIKKIQKGQQAVITGEALKGELRGIVDEIGLAVSQQEVNSNQPGENLDQRVIKVRIKLDATDSKRVSKLTNLQVQVAIQP